MAADTPMDRHGLIAGTFSKYESDALPFINTRAMFETNRIYCRVQGVPFLERPYLTIGKHLAAVVEFSEHYHVGTEDLKRWGVGFPHVMKAAIRNLAKRPLQLESPTPGLFVTCGDDVFTTSTILLRDQISRLAVKGDPIIMLPHGMVVAGSEDLDALRGMVHVAETQLREYWGTSGIALKMEEQGWSPWLPPQSHELYKDFRLFHLGSLAQDYLSQQNLCRSLYDKRGEWIKVIDYEVSTGYLGSEDALFSHSCWHQEAAGALLPEVEVVAFPPKEGRWYRLVPWQQVVEVAGDLLEPEDIFPPRWRIKGFPSDRQLAAMTDLPDTPYYEDGNALAIVCGAIHSRRYGPGWYKAQVYGG